MSKLFQPIQVGTVTLQHRVVMAPVTRYRGNNKHTHTDLAIEYYAARVSVPGTLIISESTFIAHKASGNSFNSPGIWSDEQVAAWKKVTDAVHAKGSYMYSQLVPLDVGHPSNNLRERTLLSSTSLPETFRFQESHSSRRTALTHRVRAHWPKPRSRSTCSYLRRRRAIVERGGFDGVEIYGANGYLLDQFFKETANNRTDE